VNAVVEFVRVMGTGGNAVATGNAAIGVVAKFRRGMLALGVVAPEALHGAALEEYRRANSRTIMQGEPLYVENNVMRAHRPGCWRNGSALEAIDGAGPVL
jgi:hypothetical protein